MKTIYFTLVMLLASISAFSQAALRKSINTFVTHEVDFSTTPGLVIGTINGDSTMVLGYGTTQKGAEMLPTAHSTFEIGSCTKLFTAAIISILQQEGKLNYNDDISTYLDKLHLNDKDITILDLLTHCSGFERFPEGFGADVGDASPYSAYTYQHLARFLKNHQTLPRTKRSYDYSHTNYILLTLIIEKITEQRYESVVQTKLLTPLGMNETSIEPQNAIVQGYDLLDKPVAPIRTTVFKGALAYKSTPSDMLKFLQAQLSSSDDVLIQTLQGMHETSFKTFIKKVKVGIGWHHVQPKRRYYSFLAHSGATDGHQMYIAFLKETQTAVVVMSNSKHNLDGTGSYILEMMNQKWRRKKP